MQNSHFQQLGRYTNNSLSFLGDNITNISKSVGKYTGRQLSSAGAKITQVSKNIGKQTVDQVKQISQNTSIQLKNKILPSVKNNLKNIPIRDTTESAGKYTGIAGLTGIIGIGAVKLVGFKAGGIAAGSWAASMMSSAAIANGGGVAAGSTVAILQSLGATVAVTQLVPLVIGGCIVYEGAKIYAKL